MWQCTIVIPCVCFLFVRVVQAVGSSYVVLGVQKCENELDGWKDNESEKDAGERNE